MQIVLDNRGTSYEELEVDFSSSGFKQQIQLSSSVNGYAIPFPLAQVLSGNSTTCLKLFSSVNASGGPVR